MYFLVAQILCKTQNSTINDYMIFAYYFPYRPLRLTASVDYMRNTQYQLSCYRRRLRITASSSSHCCRPWRAAQPRTTIDVKSVLITSVILYNYGKLLTVYVVLETSRDWATHQPRHGNHTKPHAIATPASPGDTGFTPGPIEKRSTSTRPNPASRIAASVSRAIRHSPVTPSHHGANRS